MISAIRTRILKQTRRLYETAGYSLIEILVATGILVVVLTMAVVGARAVSTGVSAPMQAADDEMFVNTLETQLRRDASSAIGIATVVGEPPAATPPPDPDDTPTPKPTGTYSPEPGSQTGDRRTVDSGVEFAVTDPNRQWHRWRYFLDNGLQYSQDGVTKVLDSKVSVFTAQFIPADQLASTQEVGEVFKDLPTPATYTLDLDGQEVTNGVVRVEIQRGKAHRVMLLATRVAPSGFGIEAGPQWHATVHREGHRNTWLFGAAGHSTYTVSGAIEYSTDNWKHAKTWCDHEIAFGNDTQAENVQYDYVKENKGFNRSPSQIFGGCQKDTGSREIAESPKPRKWIKRICRSLPDDCIYIYE